MHFQRKKAVSTEKKHLKNDLIRGKFLSLKRAQLKSEDGDSEASGV